MKKKYKTKVSYLMLLLISVLFFMPIIFRDLNNGINQSFYKLIGILLPTYAFVLHMFLKTEYFIDDKILNIKSGFVVNKKIDIMEIRSVSKTNSLLSSPAPSFDRIEIKYGKFDQVIISPQDKKAFVNDLILINPNIENNGI